MSKGLEVMSKIAQAVDGYHKKGSSPHPASLGAEKSPKQGSGVSHDGDNSSPSAALEEHDQDQVHHTDMGQLESVICPGCHDKLRAHLIAQAGGAEKDPVSELHSPEAAAPKRRMF